MNNYCGNGKPYIYASFAKDNEEWVTEILEKLSSESVLFWHADKTSKKEQKRIEGAHAVLLFVNAKSFDDPDFHLIVNTAVKNNKNILTVYIEDVTADVWTHMQLDSAQALFVKNFNSEEEFFEKLKESQIFRNMEVTPQQKRFKRNTALSAIFIPLASAALIFGLVVYPLLFASSNHNDNEVRSEIPGLEGLTQEELDAITDINIIGDQVFTGVGGVRMNQEEENGRMQYEVALENGTKKSGQITRGQISDLSDLTKCSNIKSLRICGNSIKDLSPLAQLPKLEYIMLDENPISSLEGLEKLENVKELSISYTDISDLTPIENWDNLEKLDLKFTYVDELPESGLLENLDYLSVEGSMVKEIPYLGTGEDRYVDVHRIPGHIEDCSFLKDISSFRQLMLDGVSAENLRPYLEGKPIRELDDASMNVSSLKELDWLTITPGGRLDICHSDKLTSLEGIEHFEGIKELGIKDCVNLKDLTPCLRLKSLESVVVSHSMQDIAESQLGGSDIKIVYQDD